MESELHVPRETQPEIEIISDSQPEVLLKENGRVKFTINLQTIFKNNPRLEDRSGEENKTVDSFTPDKPIVEEELKNAWGEFTVSRKNQVAEYQLLKRDFILHENVITILLSNPIEEPLLQNIRAQLTTYLRDKLSNSAISVIGMMQEVASKKVMYTNKEKFDHLAERNPMLRELKERLGLDLDY